MYIYIYLFIYIYIFIDIHEGETSELQTHEPDVSPELVLVCGQHVGQSLWHWIASLLWSFAISNFCLATTPLCLQEFCGYPREWACICDNIGSGAPRVKAASGTHSHTWKCTWKLWFSHPDQGPLEPTLIRENARENCGFHTPTKLNKHLAVKTLYDRFAKFSCTWAARSQQTWTNGPLGSLRVALFSKETTARTRRLMLPCSRSSEVHRPTWRQEKHWMLMAPCRGTGHHKVMVSKLTPRRWCKEF